MPDSYEGRRRRRRHNARSVNRCNKIYVGGIPEQTLEREILGMIDVICVILFCLLPGHPVQNLEFLRFIHLPELHSSIFFRGLPVTNEQIAAFFNPQPREIKMVYDRRTGRFKGFCFLWFRDTTEAGRAIHQIHERYIHGRQVTAQYARQSEAHR